MCNVKRKSANLLRVCKALNVSPDRLVENVDLPICAAAILLSQKWAKMDRKTQLEITRAIQRA